MLGRTPSPPPRCSPSAVGLTLRACARLVGPITVVVALLITACFPRSPHYGNPVAARPVARPFVPAGPPASTAVTPATLAVHNRSHEPLVDVRLSPTTAGQWGANLLGNQVLEVGQTFTVQGLTSGTWDLRVVDRSGHFQEWRNQMVHGSTAYEVDVPPDGWAAGP